MKENLQIYCDYDNQVVIIVGFFLFFQVSDQCISANIRDSIQHFPQTFPQVLNEDCGKIVG